MHMLGDGNGDMYFNRIVTIRRWKKIQFFVD